MLKQKRLTAEEKRQVEVIEMAGKLAVKVYISVFGTAAKDEWAPICREQCANFLLAGVQLQPKQWEIAIKCRECDKPDGPTQVLAGGGRGSGKSSTILTQIFCDDCQRIKGLKVLCLRKVGRANKEQIQDFRKKLLFNLPHTYKEQAQTIEFQNGSMVILGNFKDEKDIDKYLGLEYDLIYIMECNQLTRSKIINIMSCLRTNKTNWRPRVYLDTNPGGISHADHRKIFVVPWQNHQEKETRYIHSTVDDNQFVNPEYKTYLEGLVGWQREAWLLGSWEFMAGAFFSNFHSDVHIYPNSVTQMDPRSIVRWFAGLDYGFSHPTAFVLGCEDEDGNMYVPAVYAQSNTIIEEHCANIKDMLSLYQLVPEDLEFIAAGKDCFRVGKDGSTVATEYQEHGIMLTPVHIDRINAWSQMAELFGDVERQIKPRCFIHQHCQNLVLQIQSAQCDEKKPNDILKMNADPETGEGGDDELEACWISGTLIKLPNNRQAYIESLKVGDLVCTRQGNCPVIAAGATNAKARVYEVVFSGGESLIGTKNHPIWVNHDWKSLGELKIGDVTFDGQTVVLTPKFMGFQPVYNLEVSGVPEYFANGILVHNCRNMVVMAYSSLLNQAKPIQMGNYKSMTESAQEEDFLDVEAEIQRSEELDSAEGWGVIQ